MKKRILAGLLSAMMICSIVPVADYFTSGDYFNAYAENSSDSSDIIFSTDFEDGDVSAFSGREAWKQSNPQRNNLIAAALQCA